jgi:hypothetical protein
MRTRYFGHACILIKTRHVELLSDRVMSYDYHADLPRYTYSDLPDRLDYVLITHNHQDHVVLETMLQLRHKVGSIVVPRGGGGSLQDPSLRLALQRVGFRNVIELSEMETLEIEGGTLTGVPFMGSTATSISAPRWPISSASAVPACCSPRIPATSSPGFTSTCRTSQVMSTSSSSAWSATPLSWVYGPLITRPLDRQVDHSRRLSGSNCERGIDLVRRFSCRQVYVYAMGMEPWLKCIMAKDYTEESDPIIASNRLIADCRSRGIVAERLFGEKEILLG